MKRSQEIHSNNSRPLTGRLSRYLPALLGFFCFLSAGALLAQDAQITIVYTNSLNGNLDYCHCKADPNGGLVKRATELNKIRKAHKNVLLVETGDFFSLESDTLLNSFTIKAYRHIGYDAVSPGDQEFSGGAENFLRYKDELPFICGNLMILRGRKWENACGKPFIIERGGIKIGITGTIAPEAFKYYPAKITKSIRLKEQAGEIRKDIAGLKKDGAGLIVLLSHSGYEIDMALIKRIPGIDVIVGGHSQSLLKDPVKSGNTLLVQAGAGGARIGILDLTIAGGKVRSYRNTFALPDEFQPVDDAYIRKLINEYQAEARKGFDTMRFK